MIVMQSSGLNANVERKLKQLGYPSRVDRKDLWTKPRAALGISKPESSCVEVVYCEGLPRAVVASGLQSKKLLAYVTGSAFSQAPPVVLSFDGTEGIEAFMRVGDGFYLVNHAPDWEQTLAEPPGRVSQIQSVKVIQEVAEGNRKWFQDPRSENVVGVLPRIFPEWTAALYELLQNAADSGASEAAFQLETDTLLFLHNGNPFTENDVEAISFVNSSTKPVGTIGFMGIGFKAAFQISDQPEIHSPPFCFFFDGRQKGGGLFPIPINCGHSSSEGYSTIFRFPLKADARSLIVDELARFDGRPLLYIGASLKSITTPNNEFQLQQGRTVGEVELLEISESDSKSRTEYAIFSRELELSPAALEEFALDRNIESSQWEGRKERVSIAIPLKEGIPDATRSGRLQVYLPTDVGLPVAFDVQGNFLVDASRKGLRHASGPWNREHFQTLPLLVADLLEWAKGQAPEASNWADWYDFIPDWQELEEEIGLRAVDGDEEDSEIDLGSAFAAELAKRMLIPAIDNQGSLVFVAPEDANSVDQDLREVLTERELSRLSGLGVISPDLSELASEKLKKYLEEFGPDEFKGSLEDSEWPDSIEAFSQGVHTKQGRRQLAKVLAYLERECFTYWGDLNRCTIVLTQDGDLRATVGHNDRKVHTLPDDNNSFPTEELEEHYDVVLPRFRRDLNRPADIELDPTITQDAAKALERVAPTLDPRRIAADIILPLFREEYWQEISDERLLRYTHFLLQHHKKISAAIRDSNFKVKVRGLSRLYLSPGQVYFGREYSWDGERLEQLCADAEGVYFLSDDYLHQFGVRKEDWVSFFSGLGVTDQPRIRLSTEQIYESSLDELLELTEETEHAYISLRVTSFDNIRGRHYSVDDFALDPPILETIRSLYRRQTPGSKDKLKCFAEFLDAGWAEYESKTRKVLRYARYSSSIVHEKRVAALSTFAKFLREEPWLPVVDEFRTRRPSELVLNTEENIKLADKETPLSFCNFNELGLISFLQIQEHPPETTPLLRLQYAVERLEDDLNEFQKLYRDLVDYSDLDKEALREEFREHALIFVPDHDPRYITSKEAVYASRVGLVPRMAAIKDFYPDLEGFFTELLEVPIKESLEHYIEFLRDYVWERRPPIADNLRSAVESCYRKLFNHLNETEEEDREEALVSLKVLLSSPTFVFCGDLGWVDTTKTTVLYPDTPAYEGLLTGRPGVAVESHLKRLGQPISEISLLLDALNVKPISEAICRVPEIDGNRPHSQSVELGKRLSLLVRKAVAIVEREQAQTESTSRSVTLFLQEWREHSEGLFRDVRFFDASLIKVRDILVADATQLRELQRGAYVSPERGHLEVYISDDILAVFDEIADQMRDILRLDLLPVGLRDEIANLVRSNLARLGHQQFEVLLSRRLQEKGFAVEEDEELQRILQAATQGIEAAVQADRTEHVEEPEPEVENTSPSSPVRGGSRSRSNSESLQLPPKTITSEEILEQLPKFDETSYGSDRVFDLSGESHWQVTTNQPGLARGSVGGSAGRGSFSNAQAYRDAYGKRGEQWVVEQERRTLIDAGKPDLAKQVLHKSETHEGSPWDIESFEKFYPHRPILVEVKSTPDADNFEVDISVEQIGAALDSTRTYYLYRVVEVHTKKPTAHIYHFKKILPQLQFSATHVSVTLPRPYSSEP